MKRFKLSKKGLAAVAAASCLAVSIPVMAFDSTYPYDIPSDTQTEIVRLIPGANTIYLNSRPTGGGNLHVTLSGAASGSHMFSYNVSTSPWEVSVSSPDAYLIVYGSGSPGMSTRGSLHIWSN